MKVGFFTRQLMVEQYKAKLKDRGCLFFTNFKGVNAEEMNQIRGKLRKIACQMLVVKNSIFKRALLESNMGILLNCLEAEVAIVYGIDDPIRITRQLQELGKSFDRFKVKAGLIEGKVLNEFQIKRLSTIASREVLYVQTAVLIKAPILRLVLILKNNFQALVNVLKQIKMSNDPAL